MYSMKLYTILLHFSDWTTGIEQFYAKSPEDALFMFIETAESLE